MKINNTPNTIKTQTPKLRFKEFVVEWERKKLEEVAKIGRGKSKHRPRNANFLYGGKYPFVQTGDIKAAELYLTKYTQTYSEDGLKQSKLWDENTLCITIAANIAETAILKIKACFPDSIIGLIPKENQTIVLFVKYLFDKFKFEIQNLSQGVAQDNLNQEKLSNIEFHIPTLPEQQKIATFLSAVDEKLQLLSRKKELLEKYKKGVMQQIFSGKLRFKRDDGKDFEDWEEKRLGDVCDVRDGTHDSPKYIQKGYPLLTSKNLRVNGTLDFENVNLISEQDFISINKRSKVRIGDILFGMIGTIGNPVIIDKEGFAIKNVALIKQLSELKNTFLIHYLKSKFVLNQFNQYNSGGIQKFISLGLIRNLIIQIPSLPEQQKIATFLSALDSKIEGVDSQIAKTRSFKKGLLQQMFV